MNDLEPSSSVLVVRVYHGTTMGAAAEIARHGSRPPDIDKLLKEVAAQHGVAEKDLRDAASSRFVSKGVQRDKVSVALHPAVALLYSGRRGGEAASELVTVAHQLRDPGLTEGEAGDIAARSIAEAAAVVTLDVPIENIFDELPKPREAALRPWGYEDWLSHSTHAFESGAGDNMRIGQVEAAWVVSIEEVEPALSELGFLRQLPPQVRRTLRSDDRPTSIGPEFIPVYTQAAIDDWFSKNGYPRLGL